MILNSIIAKPWYRWVVYSVAVLAFTVAVMLTSISVVVPDLMRDLKITATEIGMIAAVYSMVYAIMQIPGGILADRLGPRKVMTIFLIIGFGGILLFSWAPTYRFNLWGRTITAFGVSVLYVNHIKVIRGWFTTEEMGLVMGIGASINSIGSLIATPVLAYLTLSIGWRITFSIIGVLTLLFSILCWFFVRDHSPTVEIKLDSSDGIWDQFQTSWKLLTSNRQFILLFLITFFSYGGVAMVFNTWGIPYLMQSFNFTKMKAAWFLTFTSLLGLLGAPFWGYLSDKVVKRRKPFLVIGLIGISTPMLVIALWGEVLNDLTLLIAFGIIGFTMSCVLLAYTMINEMVPSSISGFFSAFLNMGPYLGSSLFVFLTGIILGSPTGAMPDGTPFYPLEKYANVFLLSGLAGLFSLLFTIKVRETKNYIITE